MSGLQGFDWQGAMDSLRDAVRVGNWEVVMVSLSDEVTRIDAHEPLSGEPTTLILGLAGTSVLVVTLHSGVADDGPTFHGPHPDTDTARACYDRLVTAALEMAAMPPLGILAAMIDMGRQVVPSFPLTIEG